MKLKRKDRINPKFVSLFIEPKRITKPSSGEVKQIHIYGKIRAQSQHGWIDPNVRDPNGKKIRLGPIKYVGTGGTGGEYTRAYDTRLSINKETVPGAYLVILTIRDRFPDSIGDTFSVSTKRKL